MRARLLPPLAVLAGLAVLAALYGLGGEAYFALRRALGLKPFAPFLDLHNVMAAIECWHRGVDVYAVNPCDVLGRVHIYSPLWLRLPAAVARPELLNLFGLLIGVGFAAALLVLPPSGRGGAMLLAAASPVTAYALERANMDAPIFACLALAAVLLTGGLAARVVGYGVILLVGLLKFYPLVLLVLLLRERPAVAAGFGAVCVLVVAGVAWPLREEFVRAIGNIPPLPAFSGTFGAVMLGRGVRALAPGVAWLPAVASGVFAVGGAVLARRLAGDAAVRDEVDALPARHLLLLLVGGVVFVGCFLAGDNVEYRGIFLLLALPGLGRLARRKVFAATSAVAVLLLWDPLIRRVVARVFPSADDMPSMAGLVLWGLREIGWWWLAAVLLALVLTALRRAPILAVRGVA